MTEHPTESKMPLFYFLQFKDDKLYQNVYLQTEFNIFIAQKMQSCIFHFLIQYLS